VQGAVALGQKPLPALDRLAATPAASSFLVREEGVAAIEGEIAEASCRGPARTSTSRKGLIEVQWRCLGAREWPRENAKPAAKADIPDVENTPARGHQTV
jgi:hypothetical protein